MKIMGVQFIPFYMELPDWLNRVLTHHYTPKEMMWVAIVGFLVGIGYGLVVKRRFRGKKRR